MKKFTLFLLAVVVFSLPGMVRAEELAVEPVADEVEVVVPDVESRWFGVRWAFEKMGHNIEVLLARTDEKKVELELKFAEKEERLAEKIAELEETNPEAAERLGKVADKLEEKKTRRMEKVEVRIEKLGEKGEKLNTKKEQLKERMEVRQEMRVENMGGEDGLRIREEEIVEMEGVEEGELLEGKGVKIKNAKPGVMRIR
jgi:hypothetical protein